MLTCHHSSVSGIFAILVSGRYGNVSRQLSGFSDFVKAPYSVILFGAGGIINIIVSIILFNLSCRREQPNYQSNYRGPPPTNYVPHPIQYPAPHQPSVPGTYMDTRYPQSRQVQEPNRGNAYPQQPLPNKKDRYYDDGYRREEPQYKSDRYQSSTYDREQAPYKSERYYGDTRAPVHDPSSRRSYEPSYTSGPSYPMNSYTRDNDYDNDGYQPYIVKVGSR